VRYAYPMGPREGDQAPDFSLAGTPLLPGAGQYHLAAQRGKVVVLAFYPGDFTPVCSRQLASYEHERLRLLATGATLWAISTDTLEKHERMAKSYALSFPLLSDDDGKVAALYGVRTLMGTARRAIFILDATGVVRYRHEDPLSLTYQSVDDLLKTLRDTGLVEVPQESSQPSLEAAQAKGA
jgi:thioredoxin-dependent peroxiredoxin